MPPGTAGILNPAVIDVMAKRQYLIIRPFKRELEMKIIQTVLLIMTAFLFSTNTFACGSDAECANDQICNDSGQCVADGRDWKALKTDLLISESIQKAKETGACYISAGSSKSCHDGLTFASCAKVASGVSGVFDWKKGESCK